MQKSGHSEGQGAKYQNIIENYLRSAECLKAMAAELLDLPIVDPEVPFGKCNFVKHQTNISINHKIQLLISDEPAIYDIMIKYSSS